MSNPFAYGHVVRGDDYCARPVLERELTNFIESSQNTAILGPRRTGKTSLVVETVRAMKNRRLMRVNMLAVKSVADVSRRLLTGLMSLDVDEPIWSKTLNALRQLRPQITLDPDSGLPLVTLDSTAAKQPESLEHILATFVDVHAKRPLAVLIDEFQDVARMSAGEETVALMRGVIQFQDDLPYIFAGSDQHGMHMLFMDPDSAFYKSAALLPVGPLEQEAFRSHLDGKFEQGKRSVTEELWSEIFAFTHEIPGDVQQLCSALWETSSVGETLDLTILAEAVEQVISRDRMGFESLIEMISERQLSVLRSIARLGGRHPYSEDFMKNVGTRQPATVRVALDGLVKKRIVMKQGGEFRIYSPFFAAWLLREGY